MIVFYLRSFFILLLRSLKVGLIKHIATIPVEDRALVNLFPVTCVRRVKGNLDQGRRPI